MPCIRPCYFISWKRRRIRLPSISKFWQIQSNWNIALFTLFPENGAESDFHLYPNFNKVNLIENSNCHFISWQRRHIRKLDIYSSMDFVFTPLKIEFFKFSVRHNCCHNNALLWQQCNGVIITQWARIIKNPDCSTGPLACPFTHLLAPLIRSLAPHYSLRSCAPLR